MAKGKDMLRAMVSDVPIPSDAMFHDAMTLAAGGKIKTPDGEQKGKIRLHLEDVKWMVQNEEWGN
jgi:hypothetical protein